MPGGCHLCLVHFWPISQSYYDTDVYPLIIRPDFCPMVMVTTQYVMCGIHASHTEWRLR